MRSRRCLSFRRIGLLIKAFFFCGQCVLCETMLSGLIFANIISILITPNSFQTYALNDQGVGTSYDVSHVVPAYSWVNRLILLYLQYVDYGSYSCFPANKNCLGNLRVRSASTWETSDQVVSELPTSFQSCLCSIK